MDEKEQSQMQDDGSTLDTTNDENLNNEVVEDEEVQETDVQEDQAEEAEVEEEQEQELTPRQQKRVEQIQEMKLNKILENVTGSKTIAEKQSTYNPLDYTQAIEADKEVVDQLASDREQYGQQRYAEGLQQVQYMQWQNNIRFDLPLVKEKLDQLPPAVARAIDREYLLYSGADVEKGVVTNPNISYAEFVDAQIEKAELIASVKSVDSQKNVAKQAAQTGIRPNGSVNRTSKIASADDIANISQDDWEKNRAAYLQQLGVNYKPNK